MTTSASDVWRGLSVVIPAYNVQEWIGRTLHSVLEQDLQPAEILVVDDGSVDDTGAIARGFGPLVTVLSQPNAGLAAARNTGASAARGEILLFLDADDALLPGTISYVASSWTGSSASAGACVPNHAKGLDERAPLAWPSDPSARILRRGDLYSLLRKNWLLANAFVRKEVWQGNPYDPSLQAAEDLDFYARLLLQDIPILLLGRAGVVMAVRRRGSLTARTQWMRAQRHVVFKKLLREPGLAPRERSLLRWQQFRTRVGAAIAPRDHVAEPVAGQSLVLQVLLDEPGGAAAHVALLQRALQHEVRSETIHVRREAVGCNPLPWLSTAAEVRRAVRQMRPQVVHVHGIRAAAVASLSLFRSSNNKIATVHGFHSLRRARGPVRVAVTQFNRLVLSAFDRVIVLSHSDRTLALQEYLVPPERLALIDPAIERGEEVKPLNADPDVDRPDSAPVVLWMARMVDQKDPATFVRAVARLRLAQGQCVMAGDGALRQEAEALAEELSAPIDFIGWQENVSSVLKAADVFVSTSLWEGLPLALIEAASVGKPIVATDVAGNRDVTERGVPMKLVPPADHVALAEALDEVLRDPSARAELGRKAATAAEAFFDVERMVSQTLTLYRQLCQ